MEDPTDDTRLPVVTKGGGGGTMAGCGYRGGGGGGGLDWDGGKVARGGWRVTKVTKDGGTLALATGKQIGHHSITGYRRYSICSDGKLEEEC